MVKLSRNVRNLARVVALAGALSCSGCNKREVRVSGEELIPYKEYLAEGLELQESSEIANYLFREYASQFRGTNPMQNYVPSVEEYGVIPDKSSPYNVRISWEITGKEYSVRINKDLSGATIRER